MASEAVGRNDNISSVNFFSLANEFRFIWSWGQSYFNKYDFESPLEKQRSHVFLTKPGPEDASQKVMGSNPIAQVLQTTISFFPFVVWQVCLLMPTSATLILWSCHWLTAPDVNEFRKRATKWSTRLIIARKKRAIVSRIILKAYSKKSSCSERMYYWCCRCYLYSCLVGLMRQMFRLEHILWKKSLLFRKKNSATCGFYKSFQN